MQFEYVASHVTTNLRVLPTPRDPRRISHLDQVERVSLAYSHVPINDVRLYQVTPRSL